MTRSPRIARVLLTRDATETADIVIEVLDDESPLEAAIRQVKETDWEIDEGNHHRPYFGDDGGGNDVQTATREDLEFREEHLGNLADADRSQAIATLARDLLDGPALSHALEGHGLAIAGDDVTRDGIALELQRAIVQVLTKSEVYRPGPAPTP